MLFVLPEKLAIPPNEYDVVLTDIDEAALKKVIYFIYLEITYLLL